MFYWWYFMFYCWYFMFYWQYILFYCWYFMFYWWYFMYYWRYLMFYWRYSMFYWWYSYVLLVVFCPIHIVIISVLFPLIDIPCFTGGILSYPYCHYFCTVPFDWYSMFYWWYFVLSILSLFLYCSLWLIFHVLLVVFCPIHIVIISVLFPLIDIPCFTGGILVIQILTFALFLLIGILCFTAGILFILILTFVLFLQTGILCFTGCIFFCPYCHYICTVPSKCTVFVYPNCEFLQSGMYSTHNSFSIFHRCCFLYLDRNFVNFGPVNMNNR